MSVLGSQVFGQALMDSCERQIVGSHSKVPIELMYLETSSIPIEFILASRRLNYLHNVLTKN